MKRTKIALLAFVVAILSVCCFAFIACGGNPEESDQGKKYRITWTVNENLTVVADGYDTLPSEVAENTEVKFTVTPKTTGWAVSSVAPSANVKKQSDGSYKFTATKDLEIRVNAREEVERLVVTKPEKINFFAGAKFLVAGETEGSLVTPEGYTIKAVFKTGREAELTADDYIVEYQTDGAEAFSLGDTAFKITYGGVSETIELEAAVKGRVRVNLHNGDWTEEGRAALNTKFGNENVTSETDKKNNNDLIYSLAFSEPFAEDFVLPNPVVKMGEEGSMFEFPLKQWNGLAGGKVLKDTATSVDAEAIYDLRFVEFHQLSFTTKTLTEKVKVTEGEGDDAHEVEKEVEVDVPFFVITGKFVAVNEAFLYLREGNKPVTELLGTKVTRQTDTDAFTLEFDLRELVRWVNPDAEATAKKNLKGAWNDIKFRAVQGANKIDQIIDLNDYPEDFVDLGDVLVGEVDGSRYLFSYKVWSGDGAVGRDLKLVYEDCPDEVATEVRLEMHDFKVTTTPEGGEPTTETKNLPAMAIDVTNYVAETEAQLKELAASYITQPQTLGGWRDVKMLQDYTVDFAKHTFTVYLSIYDIKLGEVGFLHIRTGSNNNFYNAKIGNATLPTNDANIVYRTRLYTGGEGWQEGLVVFELVDLEKEAAEKELAALRKKVAEVAGETCQVTTAKAELKLTGEGDAQKVVLEVSGTISGTGDLTIDEIQRGFLLQTDLQANPNEGGSSDWRTVKNMPMTFTVIASEEDGVYNYVLTIDLTNVANDKYVVHCKPFAKALTESGATDCKPTMDALTEPVVVTLGDKKFTMIYDKSKYFGCVGIVIETVETPEVPETPETPAEPEA